MQVQLTCEDFVHSSTEETEGGGNATKKKQPRQIWTVVGLSQVVVP